jgi:hypothetical protein
MCQNTDAGTVPLMCSHEGTRCKDKFVAGLNDGTSPQNSGSFWGEGLK